MKPSQVSVGGKVLEKNPVEKKPLTELVIGDESGKVTLTLHGDEDAGKVEVINNY